MATKKYFANKENRMRITSSLAKLALTVALLSEAALALAIDPYFSTNEGAIQGYDPVAYFVDQRPVKGKPELFLDWQGSTWHFSTAANRDAFLADPEKYAPQFGGYCSFGVAHGYAPQTDPAAFTIVNGKLYLNYNPTVSEKWNAEREGYIARATQNWPRLKAAPAPTLPK